MALKIRKNDTVAVVRGRDRGKTGKVLSVVTKHGRVVVEGVNIIKRHVKARPDLRQAGIVQQPGPLPVSNVKLVCNKCGKATRVGFQVLRVQEGAAMTRRSVRVCKQCKQQIE